MSAMIVRAPSGVDEGIDLAPPQFSLQRQADFMRDYCGAHPGDDYSDGVLALFRELRRKSSF